MPIKLKLKQNHNGSFTVRSESHVQDAAEDIATLEAYIAKMIAPVQKDIDALNEAIDKYMLKRGPKTSIQTATATYTTVQSHKRWWDTDKLKELVPRHVFKNITYLAVDKDKIDQFVRAGDITREQIQEAYLEKPNTPYVKRTPVGSARDGQAEADSLAAAAG